MITHEQALRAYDQTIANLIGDFERLEVKYQLTDRRGQQYSNVKSTRKKVNDFTALKISERIRAAKPGDNLVFECGSFPLNRVQSSITAQSNRVLGSGRYTSTQNPKSNTVTLSVTGAPHTSQIEELMKVLNGEAP